MTEKKIILDADILKKLKDAGMLGVSVNREFIYTPEIYRVKDTDGSYLIDKQYWPIFELKALNGIEASLLNDKTKASVTKDENDNPLVTVHTGKLSLDICKTNVLGWSNLLDCDGQEVPQPEFDKHNKMKDESLGKLSQNIIKELSEAIMNHSKMTPEEELGLK